MTRAGLVVSLAIATLTGCRPTPIPDELSAADLAALRETTSRWVAAVRMQRWEDAAATFTEDATLWFAGTPYSGRAEIQRFLAAMPPWDSTRTLHIDEIRGRGDMAFVAGHSTTIPTSGGAPVVVGRYLDVRVRQADGSWRFLRDMVVPMPQTPAPRPAS